MEIHPVEKYHETIYQALLSYRSLESDCPYPFAHLNTKLFFKLYYASDPSTGRFFFAFLELNL